MKNLPGSNPAEEQVKRFIKIHALVKKNPLMRALNTFSMGVHKDAVMAQPNNGQIADSRAKTRPLATTLKAWIEYISQRVSHQVPGQNKENQRYAWEDDDVPVIRQLGHPIAREG